MTTFLFLYALHDIFLSKSVCKLVRFWVKYASGSIKLMKPGPAISVLMPEESNLAVMSFATSRGFLRRRPASFMATLVAKSARKLFVLSSSGAGVTSTEKSAGTSKRS